MNIFNKFFLVFLIFITGTVTCKGDHIIGGEMTYVCNGDGAMSGTRAYTFTLTVYRDCSSTNGAAFDSPVGPAIGTVSVYQGNNTSVYQNVILGWPDIEPISYDANDPCINIPSNICSESGVYTFSIDLPIITESYHIVYQRCCRSNAIVNIANPGESGATYSIELLPSAQSFCNSSPVFNDLPKSIICVGRNLNIDNTATDPDGDLLVYSFCSPLLGGTMLDSAPNPDAPPPYNNVQFTSPTYTVTSPMAGSPEVTINPTTGAMSGVVNIQGQFVVGICIEEYRNGQLLSKVQRDYQFNSTICNPVNEALLANYSDVLNLTNVYVYEDCNDLTVEFINSSSSQNIIEYEWYFDLGNNQSLTFDDENVVVTFPDVGTYEGFMTVNPETACSDTAFIEVNIISPIDLVFDYDYELCIANPVVLFNPSITIDESEISEWAWDFGDGNTSTESNPEHNYENTGNWIVSLTATTNEGCSKTFIDEIETLISECDCAGVPNGFAIIDYCGECFSPDEPEFNNTCPEKYEVYIPNIFSPNYDGKNDEFQIFMKEGLGATILSYQIFDRWGGLVYREYNFPMDSYSHEYWWKGLFGDKQPLGNSVYTYMIELEYTSGEKRIFKGSITLVR